ncbi:hypothetical protein OAF80_00330 [bacterium]|nr:hypothetical protein [bacterium]
MKKKLTILILLIILPIGLFYLSGLETKYKYFENDLKSNSIELISNSDFELSLSCSPEMNLRNDYQVGLGVGLIFKNVNQDVQIDSVFVNVNSKSNETPIKLNSVSALDGYYNWKDDHKSKAVNFELLPEKFKRVDKDIEAYFVYTWNFDKQDENLDLIEVTTKIHLSSNGEKYYISKRNSFELITELIFRSPIRFH